MPPNNTGSTRSRQLSRQERIADRLDIDPSNVAVRDTLDRGTDASLTSEGATAAERQARREFASEADFVSRQDVAADADRQNLSVSARIAEGRRDDVEQRAESGVAEQTQFVTDDDLDADVGRRGVSGVAIAENRRGNVEQRAEQSFASESENITPADVDADVGETGVSEVSIPEERQDDVAERVRQQLLSNNEAAKASDINVNVSESGIEEAGFREGAQRDIAARQIDQQFSNVNVDGDDVRQTDNGFEPRDSVLQRAAASQAEGVAVPDESDLRAQLNEDTAISGEFVDDFVTGDELPQGSETVLEAALPQGAPEEEVDRLLELRSAVKNNESVDPSRFSQVDPGTKPDPSDFEVRTTPGKADPDRQELREIVSDNFDVSTETVDAFVAGESTTDNAIGVPEGPLFNEGTGDISAADAQALRAAVRNDERVDADRFPGLSPDPTRTARLRDSARAQQAAFRFDRQFTDVDLDSGDVEQTDDGFELETDAEANVAAARLDDQFGNVDIGREDIEQTDSGFRPRDETLRQVGAVRSAGVADPNESDLRQFVRQNFNPDSEAVDRFATPPRDDNEISTPRQPVLNDADGPRQRARDLRSAVYNDQTVDASLFPDIAPDLRTTASDLTVRGDGDSREVVLTDEAREERAAFGFDSQFSGVDIGQSDLTQTGSGFALGGGTQREIAADRLEEQTPIEQIDPQNDLEQQPGGDGFALAGDAQREFAAQQFEQETALEEVNPNTGLTRAESGFGLSTIGQRRLAAEQFEEQTELEEVDPQQDILFNDDGSATLAGRTETRLAAELLDEQVDADVGVDDVDRVTTPDGETEFEFDPEVNL